MLAWWLLACRPDPGLLVVDPPFGSLAGYETLTLDLAQAGVDADQVAEVTIGGVRAWDLRVDGPATLTLRNQGAPSPGPQPVALRTRDGEEIVFPDSFAYDPPLDERFERMVAFGASLGQGVQAGVPVQHGVLHDPPHLLARQLGAYLPLPMLVDPLFPTIGWDDVGPAPECVVPDVVGFIARAAIDVLDVLEDEENDTVAFWKARVDPDLEVRNVSVGDTQLASVVHGPPDDLAELFVVKMVYAPYADILEPVTTSQLDLVESLEPTLVISVDLLGNDLIGAIVDTPTIDPSRLTPPDEIRADLEALTERLAATGAEVFLANMPRPTLLPLTWEKRQAAIVAARAAAVTAGADPDAAEAEAAAALDADIATIDAMGLTYNGLLADAVGPYPNLHVVDFHGRVEQIEATGFEVGGEQLSIGKFGGLLSTDGVHFGDVGYGMLADLFRETIAAELGVELTPVDLDALIADDPYSPAAARAAGVEPTACAAPVSR